MLNNWNQGARILCVKIEYILLVGWVVIVAEGFVNFVNCVDEK